MASFLNFFPVSGRDKSRGWTFFRAAPVYGYGGTYNANAHRSPDSGAADNGVRPRRFRTWRGRGRAVFILSHARIPQIYSLSLHDTVPGPADSYGNCINT